MAGASEECCSFCGLPGVARGAKLLYKKYIKNSRVFIPGRRIKDSFAAGLQRRQGVYRRAVAGGVPERTAA